MSESGLASVSGDTGDEAVGRRVSRAAAVKVGAVGLLGAMGAALAGPDAADAATTDNSFTALNNGASDLPYGFETSLSGSHSYTVGGNFSGSSQGVIGSSGPGNGVQAFGYAVGVAGAATAALYAEGVNGANAVYAVTSDYHSQAEAVYAEAQGDGDGVKGVSDGAGNGVTGQSQTGNGVSGSTSGVLADDVAAVKGVTTGAGFGVWGETNGGIAVQAKDTGVSTSAYGVYAQSSGGTAVYGTSTDGLGVVGQTYDGTGVTAIGDFGTALDVQGVSKFSRSGIKTIAGTTLSPKSSVRVSNVALTASSLVLATIQTNNAPGVFIQSAVPSVANSWINIYLNTAVTKSVKVAWFIVN